VGEIVAGVVAGPSLLGWIAPNDTLTHCRIWAWCSCCSTSACKLRRTNWCASAGRLLW